MAINGRFQQKYDYEANWLKATNFTPMKGEIIVYLAEADINGVLFTDAVLPTGRTTPYTYSREKVGDGVSNVNDLPFTVKGDEVYVGNGDMPEGVTIQILTDGSDVEQSWKSELKEYIDGEIDELKASGIVIVQNGNTLTFGKGGDE